MVNFVQDFGELGSVILRFSTRRAMDLGLEPLSTAFALSFSPMWSVTMLPSVHVSLGADGGTH